MSIKTPLELLSRLKEMGVEVAVKLKDGSEYRGVVEEIDLAMNMILDKAIQVSEDGNPLVNYGRIFIRGSNIMYVAVQGDKVII
jgi:small nuclear ribonucleoprotein (snRNP)-like protein